MRGNAKRDAEAKSPLAQTNAIFRSLLGESEGVLSTHRPTGVDIVSSAPSQRSDLEDDAISNDGTVILDGIEDDEAAFFGNLETAHHDAIEIEEGVAKISTVRVITDVYHLCGEWRPFFTGITRRRL